MGRPTQQLENQDNGTAKQSTVEPKKRRKTENLEGNDKDWEYLELILNQQKSITNVDSSHLNNDSNALLFPYIPLIFFTLHLIYEEMKLDELLKSHLSSLAEVIWLNGGFCKIKLTFSHVQFLYHLAMDLQLEPYCLHYFLDTPHLAYMNSNSIISEASAKKLKYTQYIQYEVPNIFRFVYDIINKKATRRYPCIALVNDTSKKVVQVRSP